MRSSRSSLTVHAKGGNDASHLEMPDLCRDAMAPIRCEVGEMGIVLPKERAQTDDMNRDANEQMRKDESDAHGLGRILYKNGAQWQVCCVNLGAAEAEYSQRASQGTPKQNRGVCQSGLAVTRTTVA